MALTRKQVFLDKIEADPGAIEVVDPATDGVLCLSGTELTPESERVDNSRLSSSLSEEAHVVTRTSTSLKRSVELRGGGIVGQAVNPPDFDTLLRSCGLVRSDAVFLAVDNVVGNFERGETVTGATSGATGTFLALVRGGLLMDDVVGVFEVESLSGGSSAATADAVADPVTCPQYLPTSDLSLMESATTVYYRDGDKHTVSGARGTFSVTMPAGQPGRLDFTHSGRFVEPVAEPNPVPTLNTTLPPVVESASLTVGGRTPVGVAELSIDLANNLTRDADLNAPEGMRGYRISGRSPSGSMDPEAETLTADNNP
ncbi:phage tail tube protein, partial [Desulfovibrio oxyclinae]|uniref:phage tail tube protein n=1 Tax=Desulfovibrio oxyclinae TaxID=63560 RepID=UPI000476C15E